MLKSIYDGKKLAFWSLSLVILVILWGAFVRATGSGAGCGAHWPLCDGQVIIKNVSTEKFIEFFHRLTSGFSFIVVLLTFLNARNSSYGELYKKCAFYSFVFISIEALIGAGLVLFGWVKDNSSISRAYVVSIHLINSFLLLFSLAVTFYLTLSKSTSNDKNNYTISCFKKVINENLFLIFAFLIVSSFGAITALGDTIFPSTSLVDGIKEDFSSSSHFLIRLRIIHPVLALFLSIKLFYFFIQKTDNYDTSFTKYLGTFGIIFLVMQITVGILNVLFLAPVFLQISHLALAILLWLTFCFKLLAQTYDLNKSPT